MDLTLDDLDLWIDEQYSDSQLPIDDNAIRQAIFLTLIQTGIDTPCELSIALIGESYSQTLNHTYRHKNKPTNVLSFPSDLPKEVANSLDFLPLGDLAICVPIVLNEAKTQGKLPTHHFIHLVVHGVLHLLGYDHELGEQEALEMEQLEIEILSKLGIENPYRDDEY